MTKNLIPIIINELGVEIGEEFKLKYNRDGDDYILKNCAEKEKIYRFTETELEEQDCSNKDRWHGAAFTLDKIVYGIYEIVKLPFVPKLGESYWTYSDNWAADWAMQWCGTSREHMALYTGCIFRTKKEAIMARPAKHKELTGKEWDEDKK